MSDSNQAPEHTDSLRPVGGPLSPYPSPYFAGPGQAASNKPPAIYAAMAAITKGLAVAGIRKASENSQQGWSYRGIDAVSDAVGPLLGEHGVTLLCSFGGREVIERTTQRGGAAFWVTVAGTFTFIALDGSSVVAGPFWGEAMDTGDKGGGKAESYAYRNCLIKTFCIPVNGAGEDTDAGDPEPVKPAEKPQARKTAKPAEPKTAPVGPITPAQKTEALKLAELYPGGLDAITELSTKMFQRIVTKLDAAQAEELLAAIRGKGGAS